MIASKNNTLDQYISELDSNILKLNEKNRNEEYRYRRILLKCKELIQKPILADEEIDFLGNSIFFSIDNVFTVMPDLFANVVEKIVEEYEQTGMIRENILILLENIVTKDDFSVFLSYTNIEAFKKLYNIRCSNNVSLISVLNFLTDYNNIIYKITKIGTVNQLRNTKNMIFEFCDYLIEQGIDIFDVKRKLISKSNI